MPKKRKHERIRCTHFVWAMFERDGVWYADGRLNDPNAGRHSLGTREFNQAVSALHDLDAHIAAELGLAPAPAMQANTPKLLTLEDGRKLYEAHIKRPKAMRGLAKSTQKRYKTVFDKFIPFAKDLGVLTWKIAASLRRLTGGLAARHHRRRDPGGF
jgi:hypothetical protein